MKIIEIVPNFSEGQDINIMNAIIEPFYRKDIYTCQLEMDPDYNRSVVTVIGTPDAICSAISEVASRACQYIDLTKHRGVHLRIGAIDVMPIIPIYNISDEEAIEISRRIGNIIHETTNIPIYFYSKSATNPERKLLPNIRKGQFEKLHLKLLDEKNKPDLGHTIHPTAGACVVGVRNFLIAYNIDIPTMDINISKAIAKKIRESNGGIVGIQAMGVFLESKSYTQVTINITKYKLISIYHIFNIVREEAKKYELDIKSSELIGMIPYEAMIKSLDEAQIKYKCTNEAIILFKKLLGLHYFSSEKIIETDIKKVLGN